ncbi:class I SAM-dependent methyltransferase [Irregularibacter muris]|uniref:Class I SAM-dependent methyltransferase n=1 Tax=Irregularibacter muris TaxID=1796619 RepID=A0AAE3HF52_9FIRM|nr:class I SAM-dependent methyltransferase [Irregularibacter muris]MCR1899427.1 class I SAM-dependent methyltransferase [Irregularibacter muris]
MRDNKTSQKAKDYDKNVIKTHELYSLFHEETFKVVKAINPAPKSWLDAGGGTGEIINRAKNIFPHAEFTLADPSSAMLDVAQEKFKEDVGLKIQYIEKGTEELSLPPSSFDVITSILSHHYFNEEDRKQATLNCFDMLKLGGVYITFETILPRTKRGIDIGLDRWYHDQINNGKSVEKAEKHISRFGKELFPISIQSHINLLEEVGFDTVELFWLSGMQAGFYGIKRNK